MTNEEAIKIWLPVIKQGVEAMPELNQALEMAIKALEQEPFINKPCVSEKVCEHDKQIVLDKIRADIESCREDEEPHLCDYRYHRNEGLDKALEIIDKYTQKVRTRNDKGRVNVVCR